MATAAAPASSQAPPPVPAGTPQGPRIVEIAGVGPVPNGVGAQSPVPPGQPAAAGTPAAGQPAATGAVQAKTGAGLLGKVLALMPIAAGLTQVILGLMISKGSVSLAAVPVLKELPKFLVGGLVTSTAVPSIMQGVMRLLGKTPPQAAPPAA